METITLRRRYEGTTGTQTSNHAVEVTVSSDSKSLATVEEIALAVLDILESKYNDQEE